MLDRHGWAGIDNTYPAVGGDHSSWIGSNTVSGLRGQFGAPSANGSPSDSGGGYYGSTGIASNAVLVQSSGNPNINGVLSGVKWAFTNLTIAAPNSAAFYAPSQTNGEEANFAPVTNQLQFNAFNWAIRLVSDYTPLTFTPGNSGNANIRVANLTTPQGQSHAYYPTGHGTMGDTWMGTLNDSFAGSIQTPHPGDFNFATHLHELGHAFGLKHGHDTGGPSTTASGQAITKFAPLPTALDNWNWSIMTYRSFTGATAGPVQGGMTSDNPITYMPLDIAALQYMYGANFSGESSTSTNYRWDANGFFSINGTLPAELGGVPTVNGKMLMTIWDGGGTDTYDFSLFSTPEHISLIPGQFSTFNSAQIVDLDRGTAVRPALGNVANAYQFNGDPRSLIENAIGGTTHDVMIGNQANNRLEGRNGNDNLNGGLGVDTLIGGSGHDILDGGSGDDIMDGGADNDTYRVHSAGDVIIENGGGYDRVFAFATYGLGTGVSVELITLDATTGTAALNLAGNELNQRMTGNNGANVLNGRGGFDILEGKGGNDIYYVDGTTDQIIEVAGGGTLDRVLAATTFTLAADDDIEYLGTNNPTLTNVFNLIGNNFGQIIEGNDGANILVGYGGRDIFRGRGGDDTMSWRNLSDSGTTATTRDVVESFDDTPGGAGDKFDLSQIDAITGGANNAFVFRPGNGATFTAAGQVRWYTSGGNTFVEANVNSDPAPDFSFMIAGLKTLDAGDFWL